MTRYRTNLSAREAAMEIVSRVRRQPPLRIPLDDALGMVLAEPVISPLDIPPHTNSAMDGYAARSADVRGASAAQPVRLRVVEHIAAGQVPARAIGPGEAARIFTGAAIPEGADSVIRQEDTDQGRETVAISSDRDAGSNCRPRGEDLRRGDTVLDAGTEVGPAQLGIMATLAVAQPLVFRRPRVAILASGDEIADLDQADAILAGTKTGSSNTHGLVALVTQAGGHPVNLGIAADSRESLRAHLERARDCDLLVTTAGISVGEHDYLREVIESMGGALDFWRVRIRPGGPVGFGRLGEIPWIGLPGNPVSTMVTCELFVRPAIRVMSGRALPYRRSVEVRLAEPVQLKPRLQHFLRVVVAEDGNARVARLTGPQGSGLLTSMVKANGLLVIPEGQFETPAGAAARAILLDDPRHQAEPAY
jgi:molybdopterin molybdotransferase